MYFATNINEIQAAMEAKAPRSVTEVILEQYPDATIDRNGRAHAPHDGYLCPITNNVYRGGEYLPFELTEEVSGSPIRNLWLYCDGKVVSLQGTKGQVKTGAAIAKKQTEEFDKAASYVGELGTRCELELVILAIFSNYGEYGTTYTHLMRDSDMNPVVYKGTKQLNSKDGERIKLVAMIKSHWKSKYDDRTCTYINRPKIK